MIEERNSAEEWTQQYVWGAQYVDELIMIRGQNGSTFAWQAEADQGGRPKDWNVIGLTTPGEAPGRLRPGRAVR